MERTVVMCKRVAMYSAGRRAAARGGRAGGGARRRRGRAPSRHSRAPCATVSRNVVAACERDERLFDRMNEFI